MIWIFLEHRPSTSQALTSSYWTEKEMQLILNSLRKWKSSDKTVQTSTTTQICFCAGLKR